jgi:hypothetical protein
MDIKGWNVDQYTTSSSQGNYLAYRQRTPERELGQGDFSMTPGRPVGFLAWRLDLRLFGEQYKDEKKSLDIMERFLPV